ncbi:hypothetical protein CAPTEDRAFT_222366 [Capitella teleta]|uniref:Uncharacterized protein n=1 Tax=Capitella teleta TaxID=283909 RepID=R7U669_CAPTE|nr:hypothetical protein CAPTEDRAFT_222366 [Capitella teleta]|eukprot:ELT99186.1 hypothetical protein CAPTEDRAFT_222366 [Capitella teleta]
MPRQEERRGSLPLSDGAISTPRGGAQQEDGIQELIHFVRNCQGLLRETTDMRLLRKQPLPEIGHATSLTTTSSVDTEATDTDPAYESDLEPELEFPQRQCTPSPPPLRPTGIGLERPNTFMGHIRVRISQSLDGIPESAPLTRQRLRPLGHRERRRPIGVHVLPPVQSEERPPAPALSPRRSSPPTWTRERSPPLPNPIDFIDK